jgi:hypothetical protein
MANSFYSSRKSLSFAIGFFTHVSLPLRWP